MVSINMMLKLTQGHGHKVNSKKMTKLESVKSEHTDRQTNKQTQAAYYNRFRHDTYSLVYIML